MWSEEGGVCLVAQEEARHLMLIEQRICCLVRMGEHK